MLAVSLLVFSGCEQPAEEFEVPSWTPVVAVPLVDTRFDLADVLEVLTDSLDTVPVVGLEGGRLAFVHTEDFLGYVGSGLAHAARRDRGCRLGAG